jgi:lysophospholipase L1-like esterase
MMKHKFEYLAMKIFSKLFFFKVISIFLGLTMGVVLAECGIRYYWFGMHGFSYVEMNSFKPLGYHTGLVQKAEDSDVSWELKANLDTIFKFAHFSTNSVGMRDKEYPIEKPQGKKRIVVIGDSFAMGSGVNDQENFPAQLEELLKKRYGSDKIEVLNFGVGGYSLINYEAVLRTKALAYSPDLIVIGFCGGNDFLIPEVLRFDESKLAELNARTNQRLSKDMFYTSYLLKEIRKFRIALFKKKKPKVIAKSARPAQMQYMNTYFDKIKTQSEARGIPVVLAYYSIAINQNVISEMQDIVESHEIKFVNATKGLESKTPEEMVFHPLDGHPSAETHKAYAQNIFDFLVEWEQF